jgi:hypothetical protein
MWYEYNYNQAGRVTGQRMAIPFTLNGVLASILDLDAAYRCRLLFGRQIGSREHASPRDASRHDRVG